MPSLFVGGALDPVLAMSPPDRQGEWLGDHRGTVLVDGAGHWVQQEEPTEVNTALLGFLDALRAEDAWTAVRDAGGHREIVVDP